MKKLNRFILGNYSIKNIGAFLFCFLFAAVSVFAQGDIIPSGMQSLVDSIAGIFTSNFVKVLLVIFLSACAVTYAFNRDNEKIKRNCIAIGIACGILVAASTIVEAVWNASS